VEREVAACGAPRARFLLLSVPLTPGGSTLATTSMMPSAEARGEFVGTKMMMMLLAQASR
jgi:hypothetical protein